MIKGESLVSGGSFNRVGTVEDDFNNLLPAHLVVLMDLMKN